MCAFFRCIGNCKIFAFFKGTFPVMKNVSHTKFFQKFFVKATGLKIAVWHTEIPCFKVVRLKKSSIVCFFVNENVDLSQFQSREISIFAVFNKYSNFSRNKKNFAKLIAQGFISHDRVSNFKVWAKSIFWLLPPYVWFLRTPALKFWKIAPIVILLQDTLGFNSSFYKLSLLKSNSTYNLQFYIC